MSTALYQGDCLELMREIPDGAIDLVIADPPYFQGLTHNGMRGTYTDLSTCKPFFQGLFREIRRVLNPDTGAVYVFTDWRGHAFYMPMMEAEIGVRNTLVWDKGSGAGNFYPFTYELVMFWCNSTKGVPKGCGRNIILNIPGFAGGAKKTNGEKVHPTQKPVELIAKFIRDMCPEDGVVLDPFAGSGTTGVVCVQTGRNFIGIELNERYVKIAETRIQEAQKCVN